MTRHIQRAAAMVVMIVFCVGQRSQCADLVQTNQFQLPWPKIAELTVGVHFDAKKFRVFKQIISDASGSPLYIIDARLPTDDEDRNYDYSGAFDCRLSPVNPKDWVGGFPSLLTNVRNATRDWQTDGRFLDSELLGLADYNGTRYLVQRSKVRGMAVTIEINNVVKDDNTNSVKSFDVLFSFRNDPTAISDIAAPPLKSKE